MSGAKVSGISPFFIVLDVPAALRFYQDSLGFDVEYRGPTPEDEFFGIVRRGAAMIMLKSLGAVVDGADVSVQPVPNYGRMPASSWDAYIEVTDPDALAEEFTARGVKLTVPVRDRDDGLRGFEVRDVDGYGLFFGRLR